MLSDPEMTIEQVPVMFVTGDGNAPIPAQANHAIEKMEALLLSLKGRKCYGVVVDGIYRACVALRPGDNPGALGLSEWTIPGGKYVRRKLTGWHRDAGLVPATVEEMLGRPDFDNDRYLVEFYRSHTDLWIMAPVK
jgi:hypothetical protein